MPGEVAAMAARARYHETLTRIAGVVGTGVGRVGIRPVVQVYVQRATRALRRAVPTQVGGVPTQIVTVGRVIALGCGG